MKTPAFAGCFPGDIISCFKMNEEEIAAWLEKPKIAIGTR